MRIGSLTPAALAVGLTRGGAANTNSLSFTTSGGVVRSYLLHIPTSYDVNTPAPIAFSYHGRTETPQDQESISGMSNEAFNPNYLVVYPQGISLQWQGDPEATGYDDVGFTLQLLTNLSSTYCIDSSRVYAAGKSNGGGFAANVLACDPQASRTFAAFAGISGAYYQGTTDANCNALTVPITCNQGRYPIPVFTTHGDADTTIDYNGGPRRGRCLPSLPHFMTDWSSRDGFGTSNTSVSLYSGNVTRFDYGNDSLPDLNTHYYVHGLGHTWPSIAAGTWFDATPLLLAFWNKWTLDTTPYNYVNATVATTTSATSATSTTTVSTSTSTIPASSLCPNVDSQDLTDSNGKNYTIRCSSDTSIGSFANTQAVSSYADCMTACDSTSGCVAFTYVGGSYGNGKGTCWLKNAPGTATSGGTSYVAGFLKSSSSSSSTSSSSTPVSSVSTSSTTSSTKTSSSSTGVPSASLCPSANGQVITDSNGNSYNVTCSADNSVGSYSNAQASTSYVDCMSACAAAASTGCQGFTYVGGTNGLGSGTCWLKKSMGTYTSSGTNYISAVKVSSGSLSSSSSSVSSSSVSSSPSSRTVSSTSSASSILTSTLSTSSSATSLSSSSSIVPPSVGADGYTTTTFPPTCTSINTNIYAVSDDSGVPYLYMCGGGSAGNTAQTYTGVANWTTCFKLCDNYAGCTGFSYNQGAAFGNGVGQCLIKTDNPQSFASTAALLTSRIAGYIRSVSTTAASVSATSTSALSKPTTSSSLSSASSSSTLSSSSSLVASSSSLVTSTSSSVSSSSATPSPSTFTTSALPASSSVVSSTTLSSSTSSASASPSPVNALSCPSLNGTTYADAHGAQYTLLCTYDTSINNIVTNSSINSFGDCSALCDTTSGCTTLTWNGTVCSLKQSFGQYILGAIKAGD